MTTVESLKLIWLTPCILCYVPCLLQFRRAKRLFKSGKYGEAEQGYFTAAISALIGLAMFIVLTRIGLVILF